MSLGPVEDGVTQMEHLPAGIPIFTKYMADGTALQVVEGEALCNTVAQVIVYSSWRQWIKVKFQLVRGQDYITEYGERRPGTTRGLSPYIYYYTVRVAQHIAEYYSNLEAVRSESSNYTPAHATNSPDILPTIE